jgi:hypothetical protein
MSGCRSVFWKKNKTKENDLEKSELKHKIGQLAARVEHIREWL